MRILKQRLKRVVVFLLAMTLLLQPLTAYATNYADVPGLDKYVCKISELSSNGVSELPADAILLVDLYFPGSVDESLNKRWLCDAMFYVQEPDYKSVVNTAEKIDDFAFTWLGVNENTDAIFKLGNSYNGKTVVAWEIKNIDQVHEEVELNTKGDPESYDHEPYKYKVSYDEGQTTGEKEFKGFIGPVDYIRYIWYWLIEVEPIYEDSGERATVTFEPNGGTLTDPESATKVMAINDTYAPFPDATWEHHDFQGWYTEDGDPITETDTKQTDGDEILYAHWEEWKYKIHFDPNGGNGGIEEMPDITLGFSEKGIVPANQFTREGYTFLGWSRDREAENADIFEGNEVTRVTEEKDGTDTLYAVWKPFPTVTFDPQGGSECDPSSKKVAKGAQYGELPTTDRPYHTFQGWFTEQDDGKGKPITAVSEKETDADETLYAHWREYQYTIHFNPNFELGGGTMDDMVLNYSEKKPLTQNKFTREGYTFLGWSRDEKATTAQYKDQQEVQSLTDVDGGRVTLYAVWQDDDSGTPPPVLGTPKVTFDPNGGSDCKPFSEKEVAQGKPYGDLPTTERAHYDFLGWFTAREGGTQIFATYTKATDKDETLYAHWEEYQYTIHFDANGGTGEMEDMTLKYSQKTALTKNAFTRSGYQFKGWNTDKDAVLAKYKDKAQVQSLTGDKNGKVTLYAVWQEPSKETPPKKTPEQDPPKKTPDSPGGGGNASQQSEIFKTYAAQKIENVKTSDTIYIYRYIIMFVLGVGLILVSVRFRKKQ